MGKAFLILSFCLFYETVLGQESVQTQANLLRSTTANTGTSTSFNMSGNRYLMQLSVGQSSPIGTHQKSAIVVRQGFIQPFFGKKMQEQQTNDVAELKANIFPNPFHSDLEIHFDKPIQGKIAVVVFDEFGRLVFDYTYESTSQFLGCDLGYLKSGKYLIKVDANGKQFIKVLVKDR